MHIYHNCNTAHLRIEEKTSRYAGSSTAKPLQAFKNAAFLIYNGSSTEAKVDKSNGVSW